MLLRSLRRVLSVLTGALAVTMLATACAAPRSSAPTTEPVEVPATPAGEAARWILAEMNGERDTDPARWESRLHPDVLAQVSADEVAELINRQIRPARPLVPTGYRGSERDAVVTVAGQLGDPFEITLSLDDAGLMTGLLLTPVSAPRAAATSIGEVAERLAALPGDVRVLVREGEKDLIEQGADEAGPVGSAFKLYVLGALADAVAAGTVAWTDELTVTDDIKSLPSGKLQDAPAGTVVTVREAAEKMIAISDNTATDMIIGLVGRDAVERAVVDLGHDDPALLRPFPSTREMFQLEWGDVPTLAERWSSGDEVERRAVLAEVDALPFALTVADVDLSGAAMWTSGLEWFASPADLAAAHAGLADAADPVVDGILGRNRGVSIDPQRWPTAAFKGGSSPGAVSGSWRAERTDGTVLTAVVMMAAQDAATVEANANELFGLAQDVFAILGADGR